MEDNLTVRIDYDTASYEMVKYLQELGHKNITSIAIKKDIDRTEEKFKILGYDQAMREANLKEDKIYTMGIGEKDITDIEEDIMNAVKKGTTAFFCTQDEIAIHTINTLLENGIKVPEDISVSGFGGNSLSTIYRPKLTTIQIPYYDIGAVAIRRILKEIKKEHDPNEEVIVLPVQILKRDSTRKID